MKKSYIYIFFVIMICSFALLFGITFYDIKNDTRQYYSADDVSEWEDYRIIGTTDTTCHIEGQLDTSESTGYLLAFYSIHQAFEIYANDTLIYEYPLQNNNPFAKSPGYTWNFVPLPKADNSVRMIITSPYNNYASQIPVFLVGTPFAIITHIIDSNIFSVILCIIIFCIGICMIVFWLFARHKAKIQKTLLKLGLFAILLSIWSINENQLSILIMRNNLVCSYIAFVVLMLLPFSFASFVYSFYESDSQLWRLYFTGNLAQIILCLAMQLLHLADFRETLWTTHAMMIILVFLIIYCSINQLRSGIHSKRVLLNILCMILCAVALVLDLIAFYAGAWDSNSFGRLGFLTYIILLGIASAQESASLMKMGQEANTYQILAYTDQMTDMYNRAAFNRDFDACSMSPDNVAIIDFDLNNLKKTNDTYGHMAGDKYITDAARMIKEIFTSVGNCYRIGGDEFAVILTNASDIDIRHYLTMLEWSVDAYNRTLEEPFRMQIAYGCAVYSESSDSSLQATFTRADEAMYSDKKSKKGISH